MAFILNNTQLFKETWPDQFVALTRRIQALFVTEALRAEGVTKHFLPTQLFTGSDTIHYNWPTGGTENDLMASAYGCVGEAILFHFVGRGLLSPNTNIT